MACCAEVHDWHLQKHHTTRMPTVCHITGASQLCSGQPLTGPTLIFRLVARSKLQERRVRAAPRNLFLDVPFTCVALGVRHVLAPRCNEASRSIETASQRARRMQRRPRPHHGTTTVVKTWPSAWETNLPFSHFTKMSRSSCLCANTALSSVLANTRPHPKDLHPEHGHQGLVHRKKNVPR